MTSQELRERAHVHEAEGDGLLAGILLVHADALDEIDRLRDQIRRMKESARLVAELHEPSIEAEMSAAMKDLCWQKGIRHPDPRQLDRAIGLVCATRLAEPSTVGTRVGFERAERREPVSAGDRCRDDRADGGGLDLGAPVFLQAVESHFVVYGSTFWNRTRLLGWAKALGVDVKALEPKREKPAKGAKAKKGGKRS